MESFAGDYKDRKPPSDHCTTGPRLRVRRAKKAQWRSYRCNTRTGRQGSNPDDLLGPVEDNKLRRPRTDILTKALALVLPSSSTC